MTQIFDDNRHKLVLDLISFPITQDNKNSFQLTVINLHFVCHYVLYLHVIFSASVTMFCLAGESENHLIINTHHKY